MLRDVPGQIRVRVRVIMVAVVMLRGVPGLLPREAHEAIRDVLEQNHLERLGLGSGSGLE